MERKVYVDFQDSQGFIDISSYVKYDTLSITTRACSDNWHFAQNEAYFTVIYNASLYSKLRAATKDILVRILDVFDDALITTENDYFVTTENGFYLARETGGFLPLFYGRIAPTKSRSYNGILDNTMWELEAIDDMNILDTKIGDICWRGYSIMNPSNPATSIVHQLAYIAGMTDVQIDQTIYIGQTLDAFSPSSPEDSILDVLDALLFEYGYTLNFNTAGELSPIKWMIDDSTVAFEFKDSNIVKEIDIRNTIKGFDASEVIWYELEEAVTTSGLSSILLYRDANLPYNENGGFTGYPIPSGLLYPLATNVIDPTTSGNQIVYQEYDDSAIKYWTNEAIVNKIDYNYKNFSSDYSDIVATSGWRLDWRGDNNVTLVMSEFYNRKARLVFQSTSASGNNLYFVNIYGKVLYKSAERKSTKNNVANPKRVDKYVSSFLFDSTNADRLALFLARIHEVGDTVYTFPSEVERYVGEMVNVILNDGTSQKCFILEKRYDEYTSRWDYVVRAYANDIGVLSSQDIGLAPQTRVEEIISSNLSNYSVSCNATVSGTNPDLSGAFTYMKVYRGLLDDTYNWEYSAVASGVIGGFGSGLEVNKYTVTGFDNPSTTQGLVTITASRDGFLDQVQEFRLNKIFQSDVPALIVNTSPRYWGKYEDTTPSGLFVSGDVYCRYSTSSGVSNRGVFKWDGDSWERTEVVTDVTKALTDISFLIAYTNASGVNIYGQASDYSGDSTVQANFAFFQAAMVGYLEAENLKITASGSIRGGDRYDENGATVDGGKPGFYIGASGSCKFAGIEFEGSMGGGVQWGSANLIGSELSITGTGAPAIAALSGTDVAFIDRTNKSLRQYRFNGVSWGIIGNGLTISGCDYPSLAAMSYRDVAFIDSGNDSLRMYRFNGTDWAQLGNSFSVAGVGYVSITALNGTDIALIGAITNSLTTYRFDGLNWVRIGNSLPISSLGQTSIAALSATDVVVAIRGANVILIYRFDGTDWAQLGNVGAINGFIDPYLAALNGTDVAFIDSLNGQLRVYRFDGLNWTQADDFSSITVPSIGAPAIAALNGTDVAFIDSSNRKLSTYRFQFALSRPYASTFTGF